MTARNRHVPVTYWPPLGTDGFGRRTYAEPELMMARWEDREDLVVDTSGREIKSTAIVYPDNIVEGAGYLARGAFTTTNPLGVVGAREIVSAGQSSNLRGTRTIYKAWLK